MHHRSGNTPIASHVRNCTDKGEHPEAGFTLIEALVTLILVAVISLMAASFLGQLRFWNGRFTGEQAQQEIVATARYLENTIAGALTLPIDLADNDERQYLLGAPDHLIFVSNSRVGLTESALRTVQIGVDDEGHERDLTELLRPRRFHATVTTEPGKIIILRDIEDIQFEYLAENPGSTAIWTPRWTSGRHLPIAVRFTLTARRKGQAISVSGATAIAVASVANGQQR